MKHFIVILFIIALAGCSEDSNIKQKADKTSQDSAINVFEKSKENQNELNLLRYQIKKIKNHIEKNSDRFENDPEFRDSLNNEIEKLNKRIKKLRHENKENLENIEEEMQNQ